MLVPEDVTVFGNLTVAGRVSALASSVPTDPEGDLRLAVRAATSLAPPDAAPLSAALRDAVTLVGGATVAAATAGYPRTLATSAAGADSVELRTATRAAPAPGQGVQAGMTVRLPGAALAGGQLLRWGLYDDSEGAFFQWSAAGGLAVGVRRGGADTLVPQAAFNEDALDGQGASGWAGVDLAAGALFQVVLPWSGHAGEVAFRVGQTAATTSGAGAALQLVHRWAGAPPGHAALPLTAELGNGGTAAAATAEVGARSVALLGARAGTPFCGMRCSGVYRLAATVANTAAFKPLAAVRRQATDAACLLPRVLLRSVALVASAPMAWQLRLGAALTGGTWAALPDTLAAETALECNRAATAVTGGVVVLTGLYATASGCLTVDAPTEIELPASAAATLTFCIVGNPSGNGQTASVALNLLEGW